VTAGRCGERWARRWWCGVGEADWHSCPASAVAALFWPPSPSCALPAELPGPLFLPRRQSRPTAPLHIPCPAGFRHGAACCSRAQPSPEACPASLRAGPTTRAFTPDDIPYPALFLSYLSVLKDVVDGHADPGVCGPMDEVGPGDGWGEIPGRRRVVCRVCFPQALLVLTKIDQNQEELVNGCKVVIPMFVWCAKSVS